MHIVEKIINEINNDLSNKYWVNIPTSDWALFEKPITNATGEIDEKRFRERQDKSINIITKILDRHGKSDIVRYLARLASLEPKIQELQPWVRDHVVHAINTFILGAYIINKTGSENYIRGNYDAYFMWKLCGPTHDLGYPLEISSNIEKPFVEETNDILSQLSTNSSKVEIAPYLKNLNLLCHGKDANKIIQKRLSEWDLDINIKNYYNWLGKNNKRDHGVISALAQLKIIDAMYDNNNPNRDKKSVVVGDLDFNQQNFENDIVTASTAIFIHNIDIAYDGFKEKIDFKKAPIAFLLFLCDTFQEWDRYAQKRKIFPGNHFDISCDNNSIILTVPDELYEDIFTKIKTRLSGFPITLNENVVIT